MQILKDRQYNGYKRDENTNANWQNLPKTTNDLATRTHKKIGVELVFSRKVHLSFWLVTCYWIYKTNRITCKDQTNFFFIRTLYRLQLCKLIYILIWWRHESDITNVVLWWPFRHLPSHKCERKIKCIQITITNLLYKLVYHLQENKIYMMGILMAIFNHYNPQNVYVV